MKPSSVYPVSWMLQDADLAGAVITGRAVIDYPNGGRTYGLLVLRADGRREVVYFDRVSHVFSTVELPAT
jgi:hypothetical protein